MGVRGGQQINYYQIFFWINNGERRQLAFQPDAPSQGRVSVIDTNGQYTVVSSDGYVTRGNNSDGITSDQAEFRIPLSVFKNYGGNEMLNMKLQFPNLGDQFVSFQAGSTYPYVGIAICSLFAACGLVLYARKRRKAL